MRWSASKLSRFCAHHHVLSEINPRPTRDKAAAKGKEFHRLLEEWHRNGLIPDEAIDSDVEEWLSIMINNNWAWPDRCELEVAWGLSKWGTFVPVEEKPPGSHTYVAIDGEDLLTAGRADACWLADDVLTVVDFKTGRWPVPPASINLQVNAAGIALAQKWKARAYVPCIYYAREGRWDVGEEVDMEGSATVGGAWGLMLYDISEAAALDDQPHPGEHCGDCFERRNCSAA